MSCFDLVCGYLPHALDTLKIVARHREKDKKTEGGETDE